MTSEERKERIISLLKETKIEGMNGLIEEMEAGGFFTAPCSGKFHLCREGGLAEHSLNVFNTLVALDAGMGFDLDYTDMVVCALLHDLGKMGDYGKPNYIENVLKSGKVSEAEPYKTNPELYYEEHEIRSCMIINKHFALTEQQAAAIIHHNGLFGKLDSSFGNHGYDRDRLSFLLHTADMYCSRFIETKGDE